MRAATAGRISFPRFQAMARQTPCRTLWATAHAVSTASCNIEALSHSARQKCRPPTRAKCLSLWNPPFTMGLTIAAVAPGILPPVEVGLQPGGRKLTSTRRGKVFHAFGIATLFPGGRMPPSTPGKMPDATGKAARGGADDRDSSGSRRRRCFGEKLQTRFLPAGRNLISQSENPKQASS